MLVKNLFKYLLNITLAIIVLLMSVGVSYSSIECPKSNNQKSCCETEKITCCSVKNTGNCCYEQTLEFKFDFETPVQKVQKSPDCIRFSTHFYNAFDIYIQYYKKLVWTYQMPPPKLLSQKLATIQVYRL